MKNKISVLFAVVAAMFLVLGNFAGCSAEVEYKEKIVEVERVDDAIAPADVTELTSVVKGKGLLLSWIDATDSDILGYEITWNKDAPISRSVVLAQNSVFVSPGSQGYYAANLTNGESYTFTVKSVDTSGNKSEGKSVTRTFAPQQMPAMSISLTQDVTESTNQNVKVTVSVETSGIVQKIYYASGVYNNIDDLLSSWWNYSEITSSKEFTVSSNGTYTVGVIDSDGRREVEYMSITNIDKTAPAAVSGLSAVYNNNEGKINVTWTNPLTDFSYVLLSYTKGGEAVVTDTKLTANTYAVSDVTADGTTEYVFTVKAYDAAGNASTAATASITPVAGCTVSSIELSRYHLAYNDSNQTITVTAHLENVEFLDDETPVKFQVLNGATVSSNNNAVVDKENKTATATITAPSTSSSNAGTTYTVRAKIGEEADTKHTARFNVSGTASLYDLYQSWSSDTDFTTVTLQKTVGDVTESTKFYLRIRCYNLDFATVKVQLYNSTGAAYYSEPVTVDTSATAWTATTGNTGYDTVIAELAVPVVDDTYTVKLILNESTNSTTRTLQIYGVPQFTSMTITPGHVFDEGNYVTATVTGKNFKAPGVSSSNFTVVCGSRPALVSGSVSCITKNSDSSLTYKIKVPGTAGTYPVTFGYGENSITKEYKVYTDDEYYIALNEPVPVITEATTITGSGSSDVFISRRTVTLSPYEMSRYQVTQKLFESIMGTNPSNFSSNPASGENQNLRPVEYVNWYQAIAFCNKLTLATGGTTDDLVYSVSGITDWAALEWSSIPTSYDSTWNNATIDLTKTGYRLPTEAEWEFAARGGDITAADWNYTYSGSNNIGDVAWYSSNSSYKTHQVGLKIPNRLGLYDMSGNVWEWCNDWYARDIETVSVTDPAGAVSGSDRVMRGGSYSYYDDFCASSYRFYDIPNYRFYDLGFRVCRSSSR